MTDVLGKIQHLFNLAESTDQQGQPTDEARTAAVVAIKLIRKHEVQLSLPASLFEGVKTFDDLLKKAYEHPEPVSRPRPSPRPRTPRTPKPAPPAPQPEVSKEELDEIFAPKVAKAKEISDDELNELLKYM